MAGPLVAQLLLRLAPVALIWAATRLGTALGRRRGRRLPRFRLTANRVEAAERGVPAEPERTACRCGCL